MQEQERYERALARAKEMRAFYGTLVLYFIVNFGLFIIDMATPGGPWFFWPIIGWGIGMVIWAATLFGIGGRFGDDWVERKARNLMEDEKGQDR